MSKEKEKREIIERKIVFQSLLCLETLNCSNIYCGSCSKLRQTNCFFTYLNFSHCIDGNYFS